MAFKFWNARFFHFRNRFYSYYPWSDLWNFYRWCLFLKNLYFFICSSIFPFLFNFSPNFSYEVKKQVHYHVKGDFLSVARQPVLLLVCLNMFFLTCLVAVFFPLFQFHVVFRFFYKIWKWGLSPFKAYFPKDFLLDEKITWTVNLILCGYSCFSVIRKEFYFLIKFFVIALCGLFHRFCPYNLKTPNCN